MKMLSPLRVGLAFSMVGAAISGCSDGSVGEGGPGAAAGTTGAGVTAGSNGVGGTSAVGASGSASSSGSGAGGAAGSTATGGSVASGGSGTAGVAAGGSAGVAAGGSAGNVSAAGAGGSGGSPNDRPPSATAGNCKQDLGGYQSGWVTWYTFSQGTELVHCSFPTHKGSPDRVDFIRTGNGTYFGAMNTSDYETAAVCGACVEVTRGDQNKKVVITIVDECPISTNNKCTSGHIDLSQEAFKQLGDVGEGYLGSGKSGSKGQISWKYVPCPDGETVHFTLKKPSDVYWNQVRVSGNRYEIAKLEVSVNGTWVNATREVHNYWTPPEGKMGMAPYRVRATDINGAVIEAPLKLSGDEQDSGLQFTCN
jgi:expansin (peptidoglycan-binding protein)